MQGAIASFRSWSPRCFFWSGLGCSLFFQARAHSLLDTPPPPRPQPWGGGGRVPVFFLFFCFLLFSFSLSLPFSFFSFSLSPTLFPPQSLFLPGTGQGVPQGFFLLACLCVCFFSFFLSFFLPSFLPFFLWFCFVS